MSTRCNILFTENGEKKIWLYHHYDGYPEGVGAWLTDFIKKQMEGRSHPIWGDTLANKLVKNQDGLDDDNYEITTGQHGDIEFLYTYAFDYTMEDEYRIKSYDVRLRVDGIYENIHKTLWSFKTEGSE